MPILPATMPAPGTAAPASQTARLPQGPLTEEYLISLAVSRHPDLAMAQARVQAARGKLVQAGLYPNPTVGWDAEEMAFQGSGKAGKQGPSVGQQVVTGGKLELGQQAAAAGVTVADWQATVRYYDIVRRTRLAYFEYLVAQQEVHLAQESLGFAEEGVATTEKRAQAGVGGQPDVLRAKVEQQQSRNRLRLAQQRLDTARSLLALAVNQPGQRFEQVDGTLERAIPTYEEEPLTQAVLARSAEVQEAQAMVQQAAADLQLAEAQVLPNVDVRVHPLYDFEVEQTKLTVSVGLPLPLFNRNQGNILTARAELLRSLQGVEQVQLRLREQVATLYRRYAAARSQVELYQKEVLPTAQESLRLVRLAFERGDGKYDYTDVLTVQQTLNQTRQAHLLALSELWQAIVELEALLQQNSGCGS
jgi:cobalt-zinc-cadmium efflux system outer membrane protein